MSKKSLSYLQLPNTTVDEMMKSICQLASSVYIFISSEISTSQEIKSGLAWPFQASFIALGIYIPCLSVSRPNSGMALSILCTSSMASSQIRSGPENMREWTLLKEQAQTASFYTPRWLKSQGDLSIAYARY